MGLDPVGEPSQPGSGGGYGAAFAVVDDADHEAAGLVPRG